MLRRVRLAHPGFIVHEKKRRQVLGGEKVSIMPDKGTNMHPKVAQHGPWRLDSSGLVHKDEEGVLQICSLWGQGDGLELLPSWFS